MEIILSDLEGTLTTGSSWKAIRTYYKANFNPSIYNRFFLRWIPRYLMVGLGLRSRRKAMLDWMAQEVDLFRGMSRQAFEQMAAWVVAEGMWPNRREEVLLEIDQARIRGAQVVLVSSGYQPIVEAFAKRMDAIPIGTPLTFKDDRLCGIEDPVNAYEYKVARILAKIGSENIQVAYGDTISDLPMMELSRSPVAVCPDSKLRKVAIARDWRIIDTTAG